MNQFALFSFGCAIFFVTITGACLYGMSLVKQEFDKQNPKRQPAGTANAHQYIGMPSPFVFDNRVERKK
ncbi:MAG: hypothetical protein JW384_04191 [Nitrosomonadaceae bacterium]|nr:hypothetical protein [Nitrosomonadaceae bacterium]